MRRTVGLPGTGLSHTTQSRLGRDGSAEGDGTLDDPAAVEQQASGRRLRKLIGWGSAAVVVVLILAGAPTAAGSLILPAVALTVAAPWLIRRF